MKINKNDIPTVMQAPETTMRAQADFGRLILAMGFWILINETAFI